MSPLKDFQLTHFEGMEFHFVETLHEVIESFSDQLTTFSLPTTTSPKQTDDAPFHYEKDFRYILGHKQAKRALEVAAAGEHNVLMTGSPGCGKKFTF